MAADEACDLQDVSEQDSQGRMIVMRILLAVDNSECSNAAAKSIAERPWPSESTIRVLFVVRMYTPLPTPYGMLSDEEVTQPLFREAEGVLEQTTAKLGAPGLTIEKCVRQGDPRHEIVEEAKDWSADLIIVGSHGRTGVQRWLLGSVAEHVVRHASCSVEVVRRANHQRAA
jgi:nucleotide-binding universal stress UspA family protein